MVSKILCLPYMNSFETVIVNYLWVCMYTSIKPALYRTWIFINKAANFAGICINVNDVWVFVLPVSQELWELSIRPSLIHSIESSLSTDISVSPQPTAFTGLTMSWVALKDTAYLFFYNLVSAVSVKGMCRHFHFPAE